MPVRSLRSSVMKWPDREAVDRAVRSWAGTLAGIREEILCVGYFGSYARNEWGVGSDCDIVVVVRHTDEPFEKRSRVYDADSLPVPADVLVYTAGEWEKMKQARFGRQKSSEMVWVYPAGAESC